MSVHKWLLGLLGMVLLVRPGQAEWVTLFQDDFNDGTYTDKWVTYNGASFGVEDGAFALESGFGLDDARAVVKTGLWNNDWRNYVVDFDFKIGQTDPGYGEHFALLFNVQAITEGYDRGQYYQFYSWLDSAGLIRMESTTERRVTGLVSTSYSDVGRSDLNVDAWYHARLVVGENTIKGYVGDLDGTYLDKPLFAFDTSTITPEYAYTGPIALKAIGGATNRYDNVRVTTVPSPSALVGLISMGLMGALGYVWRRRRRR